ncbi:hypothetical protein PSD17_05590 [Pseudonocardia sp. D17]|nr:hypothetical protein PSD17_05590 [Pseudonocardia sp. D17]
MAGRWRHTLLVLVVMVVAILAHAASQDPGFATGPAATALTPVAATIGDPSGPLEAQTGGDDRSVAPTCPHDERSTHDDPGSATPRLVSGIGMVLLPAVGPAPAVCSRTSALQRPDRPTSVSGTDLCTELCVSRR